MIFRYFMYKRMVCSYSEYLNLLLNHNVVLVELIMMFGMETVLFGIFGNVIKHLNAGNENVYFREFCVCTTTIT